MVRKYQVILGLCSEYLTSYIIEEDIALRRMSFIAFLKIFFSDLRNCCVGILLIVKYKRCDQ